MFVCITHSFSLAGELWKHSQLRKENINFLRNDRERTFNALVVGWCRANEAKIKAFTFQKRNQLAFERPTPTYICIFASFASVHVHPIPIDGMCEPSTTCLVVVCIANVDLAAQIANDTHTQKPFEISQLATMY